MKNDRNINLLPVEYRSLSPAQRQAFREAIVARAHRERSELIRTQFRALFRWLERMFGVVLKAVFTPKISARPSRRG